MTQDRPPRHKPLRLSGYDYAQAGTYVITVVVLGRRCSLGAVDEYTFRAAPAGVVVREVWERLPTRFPTTLFDAFIVMPNHIHGIMMLGGVPEFTSGNALDGGPATFVAPPFMAVSHLANDATGSKFRGFRPPSRDPNAPALGEIVRSLKAASTTRIRKECLPEFAWQVRYWDRIVRDEAELDRFRGYIHTNPERWTLDREYSEQ